jgi:C4-dicarboxylate-specific signal transduction histidine kinase
MSGAGTGLAFPPEVRQHTALAHLLHALNQPLTGLQCSLELASSVPRSSEQQVRTLREGLALTARMRVLVEALRELVRSSELADAVSGLRLDRELADCVEQLRPVAADRGVEFHLKNRHALPIQADRNRIGTVLLRTLSAALTLCQAASIVSIGAAAEDDSAVVTISWIPDRAPEFSPFSRPELGLVIAQAAWESSGGRWLELREQNRHTCTLQWPMQLGLPGSKTKIGDAK